MNTRVFVTGMGIVSPLGLDVASTWEALVDGVSGVDYITAFDLDGFETRIAAEVKGFEPTDFLERKEARRMDRFAQLAAVAAREARGPGGDQARDLGTPTGLPRSWAAG